MNTVEYQLADRQLKWYGFKQLTQGLLLVALAVLLLSLSYTLLSGNPLIVIDNECCVTDTAITLEVNCCDCVSYCVDESPRATSTSYPYTLTPETTGIPTEEPTATSTPDIPDPSSTPTPVRPTDIPSTPTSSPEPEPTMETACNRGIGNGAEGCDPGNSAGKPGRAGENEG